MVPAFSTVEGRMYCPWLCYCQVMRLNVGNTASFPQCCTVTNKSYLKPSKIVWYKMSQCSANCVKAQISIDEQ